MPCPNWHVLNPHTFEKSVASADYKFSQNDDGHTELRGGTVLLLYTIGAGSNEAEEAVAKAYRVDPRTQSVMEPEMSFKDGLESTVIANDATLQSLQTAADLNSDIDQWDHGLRSWIFGKPNQMSRYFDDHREERSWIFKSANEYLRGLEVMRKEYSKAQGERTSALFKALIGPINVSVEEELEIRLRLVYVPSYYELPVASEPLEQIEKSYVLLLAILQDLPWMEWESWKEFQDNAHEGWKERRERTDQVTVLRVRAWKFVSYAYE